jgi:hypothetical protein
VSFRLRLVRGLAQLAVQVWDEKTQTVRNLSSCTFLGSQTCFEGKIQIPILPPRLVTNHQQQEIDNQHLWFITWTPWFMVGLGRIMPTSRGVNGTNPNLSVGCENKNTTHTMAMRPAIAEHVLGSVVPGSLNVKLQAITGSSHGHLGSSQQPR